MAILQSVNPYQLQQHPNGTDLLLDHPSYHMTNSYPVLDASSESLLGEPWPYPENVFGYFTHGTNNAQLEEVIPFS